MITVRLPKPILVVELDLPDKQLSPNARKGSSRQARARIIAKYKTVAGLIFKNALGRKTPPKLKRALTRATFYYPDRRHRDGDNVASALKTVWDAAQKTGIVSNDRGLTHLPPTLRTDKARPRVEVRIYDEEIEFQDGLG